MSNYLSAICEFTQNNPELKDEEKFGEVVFHCGMENEKLFLHLKSVHNLKPRQNHENLNFLIFVSILPLKIDNKTFKLEQKTKIYPHKTFHLVSP
jgi:hypothetical protein